MMKCYYCYKSKKPSSRSMSDPAISSASPSAISNNLTGTGTERSSGSVASAKQIGSKTSWLTSSSSSARSIPAIYEERLRNLRVFDLSELKAATNNFSRLLKIGEGGFGSVYKGRLLPTKPKDRKTIVAIKMLNHNSLQGHKEWLAEVQFLGAVEHPNLVKLIGYCAVDGERGIQRLLVYEYVPNKSLEHHLFHKTSSASPPLPWITRLQIALGAARGLDYLHHGVETQIIYRDFKASNVLLDEQLNPKLSDFGLAREGPSGDRTHVTTAVVGTRGYAAPEYVETGHLTAKSDVWSFGVVLFEIITGRGSIEPNRPRGEQKLLEWTKQFPVGTKRFHMILDPMLHKHRPSLGSARSVATLANRCLLKNPKDRPTMPDVIDSLEKAIIIAEEAQQQQDHPHKHEQHSSEEHEHEQEQEQVGVAESFKRRMVHLAKMGDADAPRNADNNNTNNKPIRRRSKFLAMQIPN